MGIVAAVIAIALWTRAAAARRKVRQPAVRHYNSTRGADPGRPFVD